MKTTTFTNRGEFYGCSEPGDQSGEYVKADVARGLVRALKAALEHLEYDQLADLHVAGLCWCTDTGCGEYVDGVLVGDLLECPACKVRKALEDVK